MTRSMRTDRLLAALMAPKDIAALAVFRIAFGAIVVISALRFLLTDWIDRLFVMPSFHFSYWGFGWVPPPGAGMTRALFVAMAVLGALVAAGLGYRAAVALLFVVFTYLQLVDVANYLNHYYLVSLLAALLLFMPLNRAFSLDARLRPSLRASVLPAWCTYLLRFQVAVVYVNAGLAKATGDWLLAAQPLNIWLSARTDLPIVGPFLDRPAVAFGAAWAAFLFDTTIAFFLLARRARPFAYLVVLGFHFGTHLLFPPIGMFPVIMVVAALVFFDPSWPRSWSRRLAAGSRLLAGRLRGAADPAATASAAVRAAGAAAAPPPAGRRAAWLGVAVAVAFVVFQVLLPLRAHAYGGNVLWHEQGMRFSWRVMARAKNGSVTFTVRDRADGREWRVSPARYLTPTQEREMAVQPDLILQLAHHVAADFRARGRPSVEIYADAWVSLNGRPAERLLDPTIDLARQSDGLGPKPWILPAPTAVPPLLRPTGSRKL
jgi:vitamin K-dependent gamma-carboxylase